MDTSILEDAAAMLDDLSSGTLSHGDFYLAMDECGQIACKMILPLIGKSDERHTEQEKAVIAASECLKDICISRDVQKLMAALLTARHHMAMLHHLIDHNKE